MRGKKVDKEFISKFIEGCVDIGLETTDQIVAQARKNIEYIDIEIKAIADKKVMRSKLLDVIAVFEEEKKDKTEDAKILEFFKLRDPERCKEICELLKEHHSLPTMSGATFGDGAASYNFCIKQLLEAQIVTRVNDQLMCGEKFNEYMKFVLHEGE
jgi:hypothetical protein